MKKWRGVWIFLLGMILFLGMNRQVQAEGEQGRVLFISSYSYGWDTVQLQIEGFIEGLTPGISADYEFMDTKRLDAEAAEQLHLLLCRQSDAGRWRQHYLKKLYSGGCLWTCVSLFFVAALGDGCVGELYEGGL